MTKVADWYRHGGCGDAPKVSVATVTYNHEAFIADAIESVLMQEVDFAVEMVIGEDGSQDRTRQIILDYMDKYPGFIRLSDYKTNIGANSNFQNTISRCRARYVALLDGDDYWTAPDKLHRQATLLDRHPEFSMCFHAISRERDGRTVKAVVRPTGRRRTYQLPDLCQWLNIAISSMMYRRSAMPGFPAWFAKIKQGDWALQVLLAEKGDIAYLPKVMGAHRLHTTNIWSGRSRPHSQVLRQQIRDVEEFRKHLPPEQDEPFERSQHRRYYELMHAYLDEGRFDQARHIYRMRCSSRGYDPKVELLEPWLSLLHMRAPGIYNGLRLDAVYINRLLRRSWGRLVQPALKRAGTFSLAARKKSTASRP